MCAWIKLYPSREQIKRSPCKEVYEEISKKINVSPNVSPNISPEPGHAFLRSNCKNPDKSSYLSDLKQQMKSIQVRNFKECEDKKSPGISERLASNANRSQTPAKKGQKLNISKMRRPKQHLDAKVSENSKRFVSLRSLERKKVQSLFGDDLNQLTQIGNKKHKIKQAERQTVIENWSQSITNRKETREKQCKAVLELNTEPDIYEETSETLSKRSVIDNQLISESKNRLMLETKINKILDNARKSREIDKTQNQVTPATFIIKGGRRHFYSSPSFPFCDKK